jgi:putative PEP-CTERM system TPR-repeat lipoprotein
VARTPVHCAARLCVVIAGTLGLLVATGCARRVPDAQRLASAEAAIAAGQPRAAVPELNAVLEHEPANGRARLALGRALLLLGRPVDALATLDRAVKDGAKPEAALPLRLQALLATGAHAQVLQELAPVAAADLERSSDLLYLKAAALLGLHRFDEARVIYQDLIARNPGAVPPRLMLARATAEFDSVAAARAIVAEALKADPASLDARSLDGQLLLRAGSPADAEHALQAVLAAMPANGGGDPRQRSLLASTLFAFGEAQVALGDAAGSLATSERLDALGRDAPPARMLRARAALLGNKLAVAQEALEAQLSQFPQDRNAELLFAITLYGQHRPERAEMYANDLLQAQPGNIVARRLLASIRLAERKPGAALDALAPLLRDSGGDAPARALAGRAAMEQGDVRRGVEYLEQVAAALPDDPGAHFDLASAYLTSGSVDRAEAVIKAIPESDAPNSARRHLLLVLAAVRRNDYEAALAGLDHLRHTSMSPAALHLFAADVYRAFQRPDAARAEYQASLVADPNNVLSLVGTAMIDLAAHHADDADAALAKASKIAPNDARISLVRARAAAQRGNGREVVQWLEKARVDAPDSPDPLLLLARLCLSQRQTGKALDYARAALTLDPQRVESLQVETAALLAQGHVDEALQAIDAAIKATPGRLPLYLLLARTNLAAGRAPAGRDAAKQAVALDPANPEALYQLGVAALAVDDQSAASAAAQRLREVAPRSAIWAILDGDAAARRGDHAHALASYEKAAQLQPTLMAVERQVHARLALKRADALAPADAYRASRPNDPVAALLVAQLREQAGDPDGARAAYEDVLRLEPAGYLALNNLAVLYAARHDPRAVEVAARARRAAPDSPEIADTYGWSLVAAGRAREGVDALQEAVRGLPRSAEVRYHLAAALAAAGQKDEASRTLADLTRDFGAAAVPPDARALQSQLAGAR